MLTREEVKEWIKHNGLAKDGTKLVPKTEQRIKNNPSIVEALLHHTSFVEVDTLCERMYYIIKDWYDVKRCPTCGKQVSYFREYCSNGCIAKNKEIIKKRQQTYLEKTGFTNPSFNPEIKQKISDAVKNSSEEALVKRKKTNKELYGVEHLLQRESFKEKAKQSCMERYGVDNYFKILDSSNKPTIKETMTEEEYSLHLQKVNRKKFKTLYNNGYFDCDNAEKLFTEDDWNLPPTERTYRCLTCKKEFKRQVVILRCIHCYPLKVNYSESQILNYIKTIYSGEIKQTDRRTIPPKELDIHVIGAKFAIEFDGLLYHSYGDGTNFSWKMLNNLDKENCNYHLEKTSECQKIDIQLFHVFENEWLNPIKRDIWKSIFNSKLNLNKKIYARKCKIVELSSDQAKKFLDSNHLQGNCNAKHKFGLIYDDELVAVLTLSKPRFNKKYDWEIVRYCNKKYVSVVGGFSKLLAHFRKNNCGSIITYADKRYSTGELYKKVGFTELKDSKPNYFYCDPRKYTVESRITYQKHKLKDKLKIFDETLSESENMFKNGYRRIWDCGNKVFELL